MRSISSMKNAVSAMAANILTILFGFFAQKVFINTLGIEYLGLNSLFNNIVTMLGVVELGLGTAIVYHLYKPIKENDKEKVKLLMNFYKGAYRVIAMIVLAIALVLVPFLDRIIGENSIDNNIYFIFMLYIIDVILTYLFTYKRSILYADQKIYITNLIHMLYIIFMNVFQIAFLLIVHNFILYLVIKITFRALENIVINRIINKKYSYIKEKTTDKLDKNTKKDIYTKIKGLLFHKLGGFLVLGVDNIIISMEPSLGLTAVGMYSNYSMVLTAVSNLFGQAFLSITANIGNLLVEKNSEKTYKTYKNVLMMNFWVYSFASISIFCIMQPFIELIYGAEFLFDQTVLGVLVLRFYILGMRKTYTGFKDAAGIFYEDRFVPIIESVLNIGFALILVKFLGLSGIFIAGIISSFALYAYSYPVFIYKGIFKQKISEYIKENIMYLIVTAINLFVTLFLINLINVDNLILRIIINGVMCVIIPNTICFVIFRKTEEFKYMKNVISIIIGKFSAKGAKKKVS